MYERGRVGGQRRRREQNPACWLQELHTLEVVEKGAVRGLRCLGKPQCESDDGAWFQSMVLGATEAEAVGQGRRPVRFRFAEPCSGLEGYSARSR